MSCELLIFGQVSRVLISCVTSFSSICYYVFKTRYSQRRLFETHRCVVKRVWISAVVRRKSKT